MKKIIVLLLVLFTMLSAKVDPKATQLKKEFPVQYGYIKQVAVEEWGNQYNMISYEINKQSKAFYYMLYAFEPSDSKLFFDAVSKWTLDGNHNLKEMKKSKSKSITVMGKFKVNWNMAKYEYDKQVKARKELGF